jgi:type III secretion protein R
VNPAPLERLVHDGSIPGPMGLLLLLAGLTVLPFGVVVLTSFCKVSVVLSLTRSALGTQGAPPTLVLTGLAAVLSLAIMAPTTEAMLQRGRGAFGRGEPTSAELLGAVRAMGEPLHAFLRRHGSAELRAELASLGGEVRPGVPGTPAGEDAWAVVIPAFVLTELKAAFQMGFLIFLPFLVVDMVVANVLLALGMQTLSPSQVSLPFKILLFVAVDGWSAIARGLLLSYR